MTNNIQKNFSFTIFCPESHHPASCRWEARKNFDFFCTTQKLWIAVPLHNNRRELFIKHNSIQAAITVVIQRLKVNHLWWTSFLLTFNERLAMIQCGNPLFFVIVRNQLIDSAREPLFVYLNVAWHLSSPMLVVFCVPVKRKLISSWDREAVLSVTKRPSRLLLLLRQTSLRFYRTRWINKVHRINVSPMKQIRAFCAQNTFPIAANLMRFVSCVVEENFAFLLFC